MGDDIGLRKVEIHVCARYWLSALSQIIKHQLVFSIHSSIALKYSFLRSIYCDTLFFYSALHFRVKC